MGVVRDLVYGNACEGLCLALLLPNQPMVRHLYSAALVQDWAWCSSTMRVSERVALFSAHPSQQGC